MIQVTIPNYLRRVQLSAARRATYWEPKDDLPEKYKTGRYTFRKRGKFINLYDEVDKEFVVANPKAAGTPKFQSIAGNEIYARMHERIRMMVVETLKDHFKEHIANQINYIPDEIYPLAISMEIHSPYGYADWDLDNLWIYHKCFLDSLRDLKMIPDDNVLHISQAGQTTHFPIDENQTPTMIFKITAGPQPIGKREAPLEIEESPLGEPGEVEFRKYTATIYTGKKKIIHGAAKKAIRSVMLHALNNFRVVSVDEHMYSRYRKFFDENTFAGKVKLIITA